MIKIFIVHFKYKTIHFFDIQNIIRSHCFKNKRAQRALERSPESEDFKEFPFFIALYTTDDTWESKSEVMFKK